MTRQGANLQDLFLNQIRKEHIPVTIYLTGGFQYRGMVKGFDNYVVMLESDGRQFLLFKHAISTIAPSKPIKTMLGTPDEPVEFI